MKIVKMVEAHLPKVTQLTAQLGYPNQESDVAERFNRISQLPEVALFVALSESDEIMGWAQVNEEFPTLLQGRRAELAVLVVDEKLRSQGVGKGLLKQAESWARARALPLIRLRSNIGREGAHLFYQREGYRLAKTSHVFTKEFNP